jgi:histidinol-phosphatase (PHP family)
MQRDDFDDWRMLLGDLDDYVAKVRKAQSDHPHLTIKLGLEVDYIPGHEGWIGELAKRHPWDYFIGSVHYVSEAWDLDNPKKITQWRERDPFEVWTAYFERLGKAARSGLFQIIGHADLPKKFCFIPKQDCTPLFTPFLQAAQASGVAIELNTAGLRKDCKEIYPSPAILEIAYSLGVPITFGSDAHAPQEVGLDMEAAVKLARRIGYTHSCTFTQRRRSDLAL